MSSHTPQLWGPRCLDPHGGCEHFIAERSFGGDALKDMAGAWWIATATGMSWLSSANMSKHGNLNAQEISECSKFQHVPAQIQAIQFLAKTQEEEARKAYPRAGSQLTREKMLQLGAAHLKRMEVDEHHGVTVATKAHDR